MCFGECLSTITVRCKNKRDADLLDEKLREALKQQATKNNFSSGWIGFLMMYLGYSENDIFNQTEYGVNGAILNIARSNDKEVMLLEESSWNPLIKAIKIFADNFISDADIRYRSDEEDMDIYISNKKDSIGKYKTSCFDPDKVPDELIFNDLISEDDLKAKLKKVLHYRANDKVSIETLIDEACVVFPGLKFDKYEYYPAEELR